MSTPGHEKPTRAIARAALGALAAAQVWADLTPGVRMRGLRRLPRSLGAGIIGAEAATSTARCLPARPASPGSTRA